MENISLRPFLRGVSAGGLVVASKSQDEERRMIYRALLELRAEVDDMKAVLRRLAGRGGVRQRWRALA